MVALAIRALLLAAALAVLAHGWDVSPVIGVLTVPSSMSDCGTFARQSVEAEGTSCFSAYYVKWIGV